MALEGYTIGSTATTPTATPAASAAPSGTSALKGFSIGQPITPNSSPNAMKGVQVNTPTPATSTPDISKIAADTKPVDTSGLFGNFLKQNDIAPPQNMAIGGETTSKQTDVHVLDNLGQIPKVAGDVISAAVNKPLSKAADLLSNTTYMKQAAAGMNVGAGNAANQTLQKLSLLTSSITGLTGGLYKPMDTNKELTDDIHTATKNYFQNPSNETAVAYNTAISKLPKDDLLSKGIKIISSGIGMMVGIGAIGKVVSATEAAGTAVEGLTSLVNKFPLVAKYITPFIKPFVENAAGFAIYGQLDPSLAGDIKSRVEKFGIDIGTAPLYTALGAIKNPGFSLPTSFGLGFGMAKLSGATTKDALASGAAFAFMDAAGRASGDRGMTADEINNKLQIEALSVLNEYSDVKLTRDSSPEDFKRAYRIAAHQTHPDVGGTAEDFSAVKNAYDLLSKGSVGKSETNTTAPEESIKSLKGDIETGIEKYGEDATHQALMKNLEIDPQTADRLITAAKTPSSIEDINKILDEASAHISKPSEEISVPEHIVDKEFPTEMNKSQLKKAGFGVEATGFGTSADVHTINGKPAIALNWMDGSLAGFSVAKDFRGQGIATKYLAQVLKENDGVLHVTDPNEKMMAVLKKIGDVSERNGEGTVTVTEKASPLGHTYDEMPPEERAYMEKEIASLQSKTPVQQAVDDMISGKLKLRAGGTDLKAEKRNILGGHQPFLFRDNPNLDTLDTVASNVGVSSDELLQHYMDRKINMQSGFINMGKAFEDVANLADKTIKDFVSKSLVPIKVADNFSESIVKLEGEAQADLETINKIIKGSKTSATDDETVYHHAEDPNVKLTPKQEELAKQDKIFADLNKALFERIKGTGTPLADNDIYISRIVKDKPSTLQRMFNPAKKGTASAKQGGILSKSTPSFKHRTMKALIDENGNRTVVSITNKKLEVGGGKKVIHSKVVTAFKNKEATPFGTLNIKTKEDYLNDELKPLEKKIKHIQKNIDTLQKAQDVINPLTDSNLATLGQEIDSLRSQVPQNYKEYTQLIDAISERAKEFNKTSKTRANRESYLSDLKSQMVKLVNEVGKIESKYNPDDLNTKLFPAPDGKVYRIGEATTKEIEQHTDLQYYHSALASRLLQYTKLRQIDRAIQFMESWKESSDFKLVAKPSSEIAPEGWRMTQNIYFRNYNFEPRTAEVMDDMQKKLDSGQFNNAFTGINRVLVDSIFFNGLAHPINVATTWVYNRGVSGLLPQNLVSGFKAGARALEALSTKNEDYLDLLRNGAHLMSSDVNNQKVAENMVKKLNAELQRKPDIFEKIVKAMDITNNANPLNFKKNIVYKISHDMAWLSNDFLTMQSIFEEMDRSGKSMPDAIKEVARFIPDYRQKPRLLDKPLSAIGQGNTARGIAKLVYNRNVSMFGSYHVGLFQSFNNAVKDSITGKTMKDKARGADRLVMLALLMLVVYPWLDKLFQKVTGNSNTYVTRSGITKYPWLAYKALTGQTNGQAVATAIFPPAVGLQAGAELFFNRDFFTGNPVYGIGGEGLGQFAMSKIAPAAEASKVASGKATAEEFGLSLIGVHTPKNKQSALDLNSMIYNEKPNVLRDAKAHIAAGDEAGALKLVQEFNQRLINQIRSTDNGGNTTEARVQYFFNQYGLKMPGKLAMDNFMAKQGKNIVQKVLPDGKPVVVKGTELPATGVIGVITTYAKAVGVDPMSAFHDIFTGQSIKQVTNGTIIVNRMPLSQSQNDKTDLAGGKAPKGMTLDHTLPLELGGTNDKSNLKLIPSAQAKKDDEVENYLGAALKKGGNKKDIQQAMLDYKEGKMTFDEIKNKF